MDIYLETPRLVLREFTLDDVELLLELDGDPAVMRFIDGGRPPDEDVIRAVVLPRWLSHYQRRDGLGYWAAVEKAGRRFIGWFHFRPDPASQDIELGYRLRRAAWGQGYATEGARALIDKGFRELGVRRVVATALAANQASVRVLEKAGLRFEARFLETRHPVADQRAVRYALNREDFLRAADD